MDLLKEKLYSQEQTVFTFLEDLRKIFKTMDAAYDKVAGHYGFECKGCKDNCCLTRFYHHTVLEFAYLKQGFNDLAANQKQNVIKKAERVNNTHLKADTNHQSIRIMCPLNTSDLCDLYAYRPMICRLHGIPHELNSPNGQKKLGPGCGEFDNLCNTSSYISFDRTPFYIQISNLEQRLRQALDYSQKIKLTISEIIIS